MARRLLEGRGVPRISRTLLVAEGTTNHCTWRSHNHALVLESDEARVRFLALLRKYKQKYGIEIHSYCLMGSHPHVVCRAARGQRAFSSFWKVVNQCFAYWSNRRTNGHGQVVMDRMRSPQIQADGSHQLIVMRYGDLNPVRANLVRSPKDWRWSSYRHYAFGEKDDLITDAPDYIALGATSSQRRAAYVHLFAHPLPSALLKRRPEFVLAGFIGDESWTAQQLARGGQSPPA